MKKTGPAEYLETDAVLHGLDNERRLLLTRRWRMPTPSPMRVVFVGLNPSTADAHDDDPTIRRCVGFARAWSCDELHMVNLFDFRAKDPADMRLSPDPSSDRNDAAIWRAANHADIVVCAWGSGGAHRGRDREVLKLLASAGAAPRCLGVTKTGQPRHPLYLRKDTGLEEYPPINK